MGGCTRQQSKKYIWRARLSNIILLKKYYTTLLVINQSLLCHKRNSFGIPIPIGRCSMLETNQHEPAVVRILKPFFKNWFVRIATIGFVLACILGLVRSCEADKNLAQQIDNQLVAEFKAIPPLPNAQIINEYRSYPHRTGSVLVSTNYWTDANRDDIFQYYDTQLKQHGWQYDGITEIKDWGVDLGGKSVKYCKDDYVATIEYTGEKANSSVTYAFNVSWRLKPCEKK